MQLDTSRLNKYDGIVLSKSLTIPTVSRLYSLEPIGVGTPLTESISSYLTRLAQEHCVTPKKLIMGEIAPLIMGKKYPSEIISKNVSTIFGNSCHWKHNFATRGSITLPIQLLQYLFLH